VELFRSVNVDWLREEVVLPRLFIDLQRGRHHFDGHALGASIGSAQPVPLGVDFRGGTQVQVQFSRRPDT
jgi:preprotein translocase subunit SecF